MLQKISVTITSLLTLATSVLAHGDQNQTQYSHGMMMVDGSWMHNAGHVMGYNMWGMGGFGLIFRLAFWILAALGVVHLFKILTEENTSDE